VQEILNSYYGKVSYAPIQWHAWLNLPTDPDVYAYSNFSHFDEMNMHSVRISVNLQDTCADSGATRVIDVETTKKIVRKFKFTHTSLPLGRRLDGPFVEYAGGPLGTIIIFNPQRILHAATAPKLAISRDALQIVVDLNSKETKAIKQLFD